MCFFVKEVAHCNSTSAYLAVTFSFLFFIHSHTKHERLCTIIIYAAYPKYRHLRRSCVMFINVYSQVVCCLNIKKSVCKVKHLIYFLLVKVDRNQKDLLMFNDY